MESHILLLQIAAILLSARIFAELAEVCRAPRVIGELSAGIVLGPSLLGWVQPSEPIRLLAEIGIILLLFEVGLKTDFSRLISAGKNATIVALTGFIAPFLLAECMTKLFKL